PSQRSWRYTCSPQRKLWVRSSKSPQSPCSGRHKCFNSKHTAHRTRPHVCAEALRILLDSCILGGVLRVSHSKYLERAAAQHCRRSLPLPSCQKQESLPRETERLPW